MKIVYVHHHLRRGGVTRVINDQIEAIGETHQVLVVTGESPGYEVPFPVSVVPSIAYDRDRTDHQGAERSAGSILSAVRNHWGMDADLYHVHNPTLGKNSDFLSVLRILQAKGARLLLQIHDFAEDGRPQNYTGKPYPENCHYAVINSRDFRLLLRAGLTHEGLHLIPDAVRPLPESSSEGKGDLVLYPVRAIRRKNIGEAVLLSLFLSDEEKVGITLEPTGDLDVRSYSAWVAFVQSEKLSVLFGLGLTDSFERVLGRARCILTTSVKEGFGLVFLESWMGNRPLFGRLLPDICADFMEKGVRLDHLYTRLDVPLNTFDHERFFKKWERCYRDRLGRYGMKMNIDEVHEFLGGIRSAGVVDFGMLSEDLQRQVILKLKNSPDLHRDLMELNHRLGWITGLKQSGELVSRNREIVAREFSAQRNRERLLRTYESVCEVSPVQAVRSDVLLRVFNIPETGNLLLCDQSYDE